MRHINSRIALRIAAACAIGVTVAACNPLTIPNPFGGAPLVLTGNFNSDLPSIQSYAADLKAGAKADVAQVQAAFAKLCPYVSNAQAALPDAQTKAATVIGTDVATKNVNNASDGLNVAGKICATGISTDLKTAFINGVKAVTSVYNLVKYGTVTAPVGG